MKCETIPELKRFLTIQEQALGSASPEVASTVSKLADLYLDRGMLDDAEALYRRALSIRERLSGVHRSEMEESKRSLNKVLALKGDRLERISNEMRAAGGNTRAAPRRTPQPINTNANSSYSQSGQTAHRSTAPTKSEPVYGRRTYDLRPDQLDEPGTRQNKESWFSTSGRQQSFDPSNVPGIAGGAANGRTSFAPQDSSTVLDAVPEHLHLTSNDEALNEAIKEARLEVDLVRQLDGGDAAQLADCLTRLADLLCRVRKYKEMEPILLEALTIREKRFGLHHHMVATSLKNLARLYYFEGYFDRALPLFERALLIRRRVFGDNNVRVADVLDQYAKLLRKMNRHTDALKCDQESQTIRSRSQGWRPI